MELKDCQQQNILFSKPPLWNFLLFSCVKTTTNKQKQTKKITRFLLQTMFPSQSSRKVEGIVVIARLGGGLVNLLPLLAVFIKFYTLSFKNAGGQREELRPWQRSWGRRLLHTQRRDQASGNPLFLSIYPQNQGLFYALTYTSDFTGGSPP